MFTGARIIRFMACIAAILGERTSRISGRTPGFFLYFLTRLADTSHT